MLMSITCAHCGQTEATAAGVDAKPLPEGDFYTCPACGKVSVSTGHDLRRATLHELAEAGRDWRAPRTGLPTLIAFDGRG